MRFVPMTLAVLLLSFPVLSFGDPPEEKGTPPGLAKKGGVPPGLAKKGGLPPGLAKKGGLPPGLAKKFGAHRPEKAYVAFDPLHEDRAWFLINGKWVLMKRFDASLRAEVRDALQLPPVPPPVPLPSVRVQLRVVLFE
jgi:hypothetical protein